LGEVQRVHTMRPHRHSFVDPKEKRSLSKLEPSRPTRLRQSWVPLSGLAAVFLIEMLDNSILNVALPTIGRQLDASSTALEWITVSYTLIFGSLMIPLGTLADRFGRRKTMLIGLVVLGTASLLTLLVTATWQVIAIRAVTGVAAAMTAPGAMSLAFRLFTDDQLRVRAVNTISTVGLIGMAVGPIAGGFMLPFAPWQVLLALNAPVALLAIIGICFGIPADRPEQLHQAPIDVAGAILGALTVVAVLLTPTLFADAGVRAPLPWVAVGCFAGFGVLFILRERYARQPMIDLELLARPLVASGLFFKAAGTLAIGALGYLATLHLQFAFGWSPGQAALGMLPQVTVLIAGGALIRPLITRTGMTKAAWYSSAAVVAGLAVYGALGTRGYVWIAVALTLVATGMRVVGVVAGTNVMRGLPQDRTTIGAALADTSGQVGTSVGIAIAGVIITSVFAGSVANGKWNMQQFAQFDSAITTAGLVLAFVAAVLVGSGIALSKNQPAQETA
jgi:MFS family permease